MLTPTKAAEELGIHNQSFYNYRKAGRLPFLVYQGMVATFAPARAEEYEEELVIEKGATARMSKQAAEIAKRYHHIRPGARIKLAEGGHAVIPDDSIAGSISPAAPDREVILPKNVSADMIPAGDRPKKAVKAAGVSLEIPGVGRLVMDEQPQSSEDTQLDLLIAITARLYNEMTALDSRYHEMVGKHAIEVDDLKAKLARAENDHHVAMNRVTKQLAETERLLEDLTNPTATASVPVHVPATSMEIVEAKDKLVTTVTEKHPELGEFIKRLPFVVAHPT